MASQHDTCWGPLVPTILCHWPCCASSFVRFGTQGSVFLSGWSMTDSCLDLWNFRAFERWRIGRNLCQVTLFQTLEYIYIYTWFPRHLMREASVTGEFTLRTDPSHYPYHHSRVCLITTAPKMLWRFSLQLRILQVRFPTSKGYILVVSVDIS